MNPDLVGKSEYNISLLKEQLKDLQKYRGELDSDIWAQWVTGVWAPITKGISDVSLSILEKSTGVFGKTINKSYEFTQKVIEIKTSDGTRTDQALDGIEGIGIVAEDDRIKLFTALGQSFEDFKDGKYQDSIGGLLKSLNILKVEEKLGLDGLSTSYDAGKNVGDAYSNSQDILSESERLRGMFDREIQKVQEQIMEEEGLLYKHSNGEKGNIQGLLNSKNQFRRLDGVLMQIEKGIQRVKVNLG